MKTCKDCKVSKPLDDFKWFKPGRCTKSYRRPYCLPCSNKRSNAAYHKYKNKYAVRKHEAARRRNEQHRLAALFHYSGGDPRCACCEERGVHFLAVDHLNGGGAQHRKSVNNHFFLWLKKEGYPGGFQVLCHNCNFAKWKLGICPHQKEIIL